MKYLAKLSQLVNKTFPLWVVICCVAAYIIPEAFKIFVPYISIMLGVVMFGMGLTLSAADFREVFRRPKDVFVGVAAQFTIMPLSAYALCWAMDLPPELAVGLILLGCCPGGTASNVVTFLARGDVALSVTVTSMTTLLAPVMTPALMWVLASQWVAMDPTAMFVSIAEIIILPIAAGVVVHSLLGKRIEPVQAALPIVSVTAIVLIAGAVVAVSKPQLPQIGALLFAAVAVQNALGMVLGWYAAKFFGMNLAKQKCLAFEVGMQNSSLGVALAAAHFAASPVTALPSAVAAVWHNVACPVVAAFMTKRSEAGGKDSLFSRFEAQAQGAQPQAD